jgi:catechol 2,3-dioxygenase-like lactoylglutathione lyase family enzyme
MTIKHIIPQLRTTDMTSSVNFYTEKLGFRVEFNYEDFYVGIRAGHELFHLKLVDEQDPSIAYVDEGGHLHLYIQTDNVAAFAARLKERDVSVVEDVHNTPWNTKEFVIHDDQGHTLYFGEPL